MAKFICQVTSRYGYKGDEVELKGVDKLNAEQARYLKPKTSDSKDKVFVTHPKKSDKEK